MPAALVFGTINYDADDPSDRMLPDALALPRLAKLTWLERLLYAEDARYVVP